MDTFRIPHAGRAALDLLRDPPGKRLRSIGHANRQPEERPRARLRDRDVHDCRAPCPQAEHLRVLCDSDHANGAEVVGANPNHGPDGIPTRECALSRRLRNDGHTLGRRIVVRRKITAGKEPDPDGREVVRRDGGEHDGPRQHLSVGVESDLDVSTAGNGRERHHSRALDAGSRAHASQHLVLQRHDAAFLIGGPTSFDRNEGDAGRREAAVHARDVSQRSHEQRRRTHQQQGKRKLRDHNAAIEESSPATHAATPTGLQGCRQVRARTTDGGYETEHGHTGDRNHGSEREQRGLEAPVYNVRVHRHRAGNQVLHTERSPRSERQREDPTGTPGETLVIRPDHTPARCAERHAHCDLPLARWRARGQVPNVRARDGQHHAGTGHEV